LPGKYATPLHLEPKRSIHLAWFLLCTHAAALLVLMFSGLTALQTFGLACLVLVSVAYTVPRYVLKKSNSLIKSMTWLDNERWILQKQSGETVKANLHRNVFIRSWLVIIYLKDENRKRHHVLLLPDMLDMNTFRRLRVRLLIEINQADTNVLP